MLETDEQTESQSGDQTEIDDGRRARRDRNRASVVDAMLGLYDEGNLAPSADQISERAGLSARSLFRYFDDIDDLCRAAVSRQLERVRPTLTIASRPDQPLAQRIIAVVDQRLRMFDVIGSVGHVSRLRAPFQPLIATQLTQARAFLRHQLEVLFATELATMPGRTAQRAVAAADVISSFEAYHLLRGDQGLSRTEAAAVLEDALGRLFTDGTVRP